MKRLALSILAVAVTASAGGAFAYGNQGQSGYYDSRNASDYSNGRYVGDHPRTDRAQVIRVERIRDPYSDSGYERQQCWNERTNGYEDGYYRDSNGRLYREDGSRKDSNVNGTIIGALIGGALGNQAGKGDGKKAATIGGAVIGGVIGNRIDNSNDSYDQYRDNSGTVRRCRMVSDNRGDTRYNSGYSVTYRYAGQNYQAYTRQNPGRYIRVLVDVRPQEEGYGSRR